MNKYTKRKAVFVCTCTKLHVYKSMKWMKKLYKLKQLYEINLLKYKFLNSTYKACSNYFGLMYVSGLTELKQ